MVFILIVNAANAAWQSPLWLLSKMYFHTPLVETSPRNTLAGSEIQVLTASAQGSGEKHYWSSLDQVMGRLHK